ncbi:MAG: MBL fold metallo-hydrolase [Eubacteriales bacterium]|nr:MBL fold metallo-hydrolase [Eubacteriales bacterium]
MDAFVKLAENVYRLEVPFPGCWAGAVLVRGEENILVDSGGCAETVDTAIVPALAALGLRPTDITWLALTHVHGDHVGGLGRLREIHPGLKVAAFADSAERVADPRAYSAEIRARFPAYSAATPARLDGAKLDLPLEDGDCLGPLKLLHTPGHDTDSCSYLDTRTGTLITGDSLQLNGTVSQGCALLMDVVGYERTLHRLLDTPVQTIVCGHPYLPLGPGAEGADECRRYLEACLACYRHDEGFVNGMLAAGESDIAVIARALVDEVGGKEPKFLFLPMTTVAEYISKRKKRS